MNIQVLELIGKLLALFVFLVLIPKLNKLINTNIDKTTKEALLIVINSFVKAAEQLYKKEDPTGIKRKDYVKQCLIYLGYEFDSELNSYIESAVYELNKESEE